MGCEQTRRWSMPRAPTTDCCDGFDLKSRHSGSRRPLLRRRRDLGLEIRLDLQLPTSARHDRQQIRIGGLTLLEVAFVTQVETAES